MAILRVEPCRPSGVKAPPHFLAASLKLEGAGFIRAQSIIAYLYADRWGG
jgi:hypothetical protein